MRRWILLPLLIVACLAASPASADPVSASFAAFLAANTALSATAALAVATFVVNTAVTFAVNFALSKLGGKSKTQAAERQASVLNVQLGEVPREVIFGRARTAGSLVDIGDFGGKYGTDSEWECLAVADHLCDALETIYVNDEAHAYAGDGAVAGFSGKLEVYWRAGGSNQYPPSVLQTPSGFGSQPVLDSVAHVWVRYIADAPNASTPVWSGRPSFSFVIRGKRCYDPRKDGSVGGSGSHRWSDPSTWEWSENAKVCHYNYVRGIYALDQVGSSEQLLIGRGLSDIEAPPADQFAKMNVCDEDVALKAGGTQKRYRVGGVIRASEAFEQVDANFAAAMAGVIIQPSGGVDIEPGQAKSFVWTITDDDLLSGSVVEWDDFLPPDQRVNSVTGQYVAPDQGWQTVAAPIRRSLADVTADGGPLNEDLPLVLVTDQAQAQRCAEILRKQRRLERSAKLSLGPRFRNMEAGDWAQIVSTRRTGGAAIGFRIESADRNADYQTTTALKEIAASCFGWTAATDEATPGTAPVNSPGTLAGLELDSVNIVAQDIDGSPGFRATWSTSTIDAAITSVTAEVRLNGSAEITPVPGGRPEAGVTQSTAGVPLRSNIQVRVRPIGPVGRQSIPSSWFNLTSGGLADLDDAVGDGLLDLNDKQIWVPQLQGLVNARTAIRSQADAMGLTTGGASPVRTAYESAATALDSALAALTSPVAWNNYGDVTTVSSPATLRAAFAGAVAAERNLQSEMALGSVAPANAAQPDPLTVNTGFDSGGTPYYELVASIPAGSRNSEADLEGYDFRLSDGTNTETKAVIDPTAGQAVKATWRVIVGRTYVVDVKAYRRNGKRSAAWSTNRSKTISADTTPPGPITSVNLFSGANAVQLVWSNPTDADFAGVRIYQGTTSTGSAAVAIGDLVVGLPGIAGSIRVLNIPIDGAPRYFFGATIDTAGNEAATRTLIGYYTAVRAPLNTLDQNILQRTGGGLFTGELTADTTGSHIAGGFTGQTAWATYAGTIASVVTPGKNLLPNPSGALGVEFWTATNLPAGTAWLGEAHANFGSWMHLSGLANHAALTADTVFASNLIPLGFDWAGNVFRLAGEAFAYGITGTCQVLLLAIAADGTTISGSATANLNSAAGQQTYDVGLFTAPSGTYYLQVIARIASGATFASGVGAYADFGLWRNKAENNSVKSVFSDEATGAAVANRTKYQDQAGRAKDWRAFPLNTVRGEASSRDVQYPLAAGGSTSITVTAHTYYASGQTVSVPSATITGLTASTSYDVFYDFQTSSYVAVASLSAQSYRTSTNRYLYIDSQGTDASGGGSYSPPPAPPGRGGASIP